MALNAESTVKNIVFDKLKVVSKTSVKTDRIIVFDDMVNTQVESDYKNC